MDFYKGIWVEQRRGLLCYVSSLNLCFLISDVGYCLSGGVTLPEGCLEFSQYLTGSKAPKVALYTKPQDPR